MVIVQLTEKSGHKESGIIYGSNEAIVNKANYLNTIREEDKQIVKMNITRTGKDTGLLGCKKRNIEYEFKYNEKKKCYAY